MKMRVLIAVLALVATPVIASVAQDRGSTPPASGDNRGVRHSDARSGDKDADAENCEKDAENSHRWQEGRHLGDKNDDKQCGGSTGGTGGTGGTNGVGTISGLVFYDMYKTGVWVAGDPGIAGWTIQLSGPVTLTATSDFLGNYAFTGVPAGTYTLCQAKVSVWTQSLPASNGCYTVVLAGGAVLNTYYFGFWM
jgi:hypothetical protein